MDGLIALALAKKASVASLNGSGAPSTSLTAKKGDLYLDSTNNQLYVCTNYVSSNVSDLTGLTITFNDILTEADFTTYKGTFSVNFTDGSNAETRLEIRVDNSTLQVGGQVTGAAYMGWRISQGLNPWVLSNMKTITFSNGTDITNTKLITFILRNATIQGTGSTWMALDSELPEISSSDVGKTLFAFSDGSGGYMWGKDFLLNKTIPKFPGQTSLDADTYWNGVIMNVDTTEALFIINKTCTITDNGLGILVANTGIPTDTEYSAIWTIFDGVIKRVEAIEKDTDGFIYYYIDGTQELVWADGWIDNGCKQLFVPFLYKTYNSTLTDFIVNGTFPGSTCDAEPYVPIYNPFDEYFVSCEFTAFNTELNTDGNATALVSAMRLKKPVTLIVNMPDASSVFLRPSADFVVHDTDMFTPVGYGSYITYNFSYDTYGELLAILWIDVEGNVKAIVQQKPKELPDVSVVDEGKVPVVNNLGAWAVSDPPASGAIVHKGSGAPTSMLSAKEGDFYRDTVTNRLYVCTSYTNPLNITDLAGLTIVMNLTGSVLPGGIQDFSYDPGSSNWTSQVGKYDNGLFTWWGDKIRQIGASSGDLYFGDQYNPERKFFVPNGQTENIKIEFAAYPGKNLAFDFKSTFHCTNSEFIAWIVANAADISGVGATWAEVVAIPDGIPAVTSSDEGKMPVVDSNGDWDLTSPFEEETFTFTLTDNSTVTKTLLVKVVSE